MRQGQNFKDVFQSPAAFDLIYSNSVYAIILEKRLKNVDKKQSPNGTEIDLKMDF